MKALITGHKGYIGSHLYNILNGGPHIVHGIDLKDGLDIIHSLPDSTYDVVFHMAALPRVGFSIENPAYTLRHNVYATSILLEWAKDHDVKRVIFSSSSAVYGDGAGPNSPYGLHKLLSEEECRLYSKIYGLDTVCLRYFNAYSEDQEYGGSYSTVISAWLEMIRRDQPLRIDGDGSQSRDFIHVDDIVDANIFCMNYKESFGGKYYDVGSGQIISLNDIKELILLHNNVKFINGGKRQGDVKHTAMTDVRLTQLGWEPKCNFRDDIISYFKEKGNE
jgi:UDP-glucose 4-epimerase